MQIYFVTSRVLSDRPLEEVVKEALLGGVDLVQIREKDLSAEELLQLAQKILPICQQAGVKCIINTNLAVAHHIDADGIHLGVGSPSIGASRKILGPEKLIGSSVHSVEEAIEAAEAGADYLIAGHIYQTNSKPGLEPRGLNFLAEVAEAVQIPVYAIGGITPERMAEVGKTGAKGVAILSGIMAATDPAQAVAEYKSKV